jgi:glycosyltransferase involved in cell wall biosynthesis
MTLVERPITSGGGEVIASLICERLDPRKFERMLCSTRDMPAHTFEEQLQAAGVRVLVLRRRSRFDLSEWLRLYRVLRRERVDILHAHMFGSNVWGTVLGRLARVPVVIAHEHTWSYEGRPLRRFLDREVVGRGADAFVAVSREDGRKMTDVEGINPRVIRFVPNGIPTLQPRGVDVRRELGLDPTAPVIATVGQLRAQKAIDVLIRATEKLAPRFPSLAVLVVGYGFEEPALRSLVSELGLQDVVRFLGRRDDVPDVLAAVDVAVCCSDFEGSPLSVMEYMAAGKPVVGTRVGGIPDLIDDGVHGLIIPPRDVAALADAIARLIEDPERAKAMGIRGQERQRAEFSVESLVRRIEELYEELYMATGRAKRELRTAPRARASVSC